MPRKTRTTDLEDLPSHAMAHGFRTSTFGTILGRPIMLAELRRILTACPVSSTAVDYASAALDQNVLGKPTASARGFAFRNLREFYALEPTVRIFRALRDLWEADAAAQPMLALLCATARDPILRAVTPLVLRLRPGETLTPVMISEEAERRFPGKFGPSTLGSLGRNAASSWEQAGLLYGRRYKDRVDPDVRPTAVAYALLLGDLCGHRGQALFDTIWARLLDTAEPVLREHAVAASRQGWIEYRASGDVIAISFRHLMREHEKAER